MTPKQPYNIYIASCEKDGGIFHYRLENNKLRMVRLTPADRPMYMTIYNNRMYVLLRAPFENDESGLVVYDIAFDGSLKKRAEPISTKGVVACHHTVLDGQVYCVNYISGNVVKIPDTIVEHYGKSVNPTRQNSPHTHYVCESPDGNYMFVTDLGLDKILVYNKDLSLASTVDLPKGHGPRHLALSTNGKTVFCVNELKSTVSVLEYLRGELKLIDTVNALPNNFYGQSTSAAIRCSDDMVYVSNRGHDSISILKFSNNKLILKKTISTYGNEPRDFVVIDDLFIVTNQISNNVCVISKDSGNLLCSSTVEAPVAVLIN